jgi:hypothetical protein
MPDFTSEMLLAIINKVQPVFNQLRFYSHPNLPAQRTYPCVEIFAENPQSKEEGVQLIKYTTKFIISIFIKHFDRAQDTINIEVLERNIMFAIFQANINEIGKLIIENTTPQRGPIKDNPFRVDGMQSEITLYFQELEAVVGIIGLQQLLTIGSITDLQILGETGRAGRDDTLRADDSGNTKSNKGKSVKNRFWEYPYTITNFEIIQGLIDADNEISVILKEGADQRSITCKPVDQRHAVRYDGQKTVILEVQIPTV